MRASVALPGLLPPVILDNRVLVDGAVAKNYPADLMRERRPGTLVGVDVTRAKGLSVEEVRRPPFWPWLFSGAWRQGPPIVSVLMRSATLMTARDIEAARLASDFYVAPNVDGVEIRDWKAFGPAMQAGERAALAALADAGDDMRERLGLSPRVEAEAPAVLEEPLDLSRLAVAVAARP